MDTLLGIAFSPWTHKARWALEHAGLPFTYQDYLPTLGEPGLRLRLRQWRGHVAVPVLFRNGREPLQGGLAIAEYAAAQREDAALGDLRAAAEWDQLANQALSEARMRTARRVTDDPKAQEEQLLGLAPEPLRGPLRPVVQVAIHRMRAKYGHLSETGAMRSALQRTRAQLARSGGAFLLGTFSYADIAMACALEMVQPIARVQRSRPHTRACWTWPELVEEFQDLIQWRARLLSSGVTRFSQYRAA